MGEYPLMQVKSEGQLAFQDETPGNENPDGSSPEKNNETDQTLSSDGDQKPDAQQKDGGSKGTSGLHTPPPERWIERENDWKKRFNDQEVRHTSELMKLREDFERRFVDLKPKTPGDTPIEVPDWFGGDEINWTKYSAHTQELINKAVEKALGEVQKKTLEEQKAIDEATRWFRDQTKEIEEDKEINPKGLKVDRNKLLKFTIDNKFVDVDTGKWDYKKAFKFMKPEEVFQAKKDLAARKGVAGALGTDNRPESKPELFKTSKDFQNPFNKPW